MSAARPYVPLGFKYQEAFFQESANVIIDKFVFSLKTTHSSAPCLIGFTMRFIFFLLGIIAVIIGFAIYAWLLYNHFWPTDSFGRSQNVTLGQYIFPSIMIAVGIKWIIGKRRKPHEQPPPANDSFNEKA